MTRHTERCLLTSLLLACCLVLIAISSSGVECVDIWNSLPSKINADWFLNHCDYDEEAYQMSMEADSSFFQDSFDMWTKSIRGLPYKTESGIPPWKNPQFCYLFTIRMRWIAKLFAWNNCANPASKWCEVADTTEPADSSLPKCSPWQCYSEPESECQFGDSATPRLGICKKNVGCLLHCAQLVSSSPLWPGEYAGKLETNLGLALETTLRSDLEDNNKKKSSLFEKLSSVLKERKKRGKRLIIEFNECDSDTKSCIYCGPNTMNYRSCVDGDFCCICLPF
eukprot:TRINITY_DN1377_c0_g1_i1.p1 TRINITY_DN1377_c0_g1~~TRINITY_DN1377_c0_g1_i1.p1  ORF type:complete len:281 (-),score=61.36 TRINITY_DN1377_c0_g1_i1:62-904(-)